MDQDVVEQLKSTQVKTSGIENRQAGVVPEGKSHTVSRASLDGLSQAEVQRRRELCGYNELPEEKVNPILKFLSYF